jgi:hypothetical protein
MSYETEADTEDQIGDEVDDDEDGADEALALKIKRAD